MRHRMLLSALLGAVACAGDGQDGEPAATVPWDDYVRVVAAEDARPASGEAGTDTLVVLAGHDDPFIRRAAVRGLGRLEHPELLAPLASALEDEDPEVRAEAAWALAQAVHGADGSGAWAVLDARMREEEHAGVRGALAHAGARTVPGPERPDLLRVLLDWSAPDAPTSQLLGVARGMEVLSRTAGGAAADPDLLRRLHELSRHGRDEGSEDPVAAARVRAVALLALGQRGNASADALAGALADPDAGVRRVAARFLPTAGEALDGTDVMRALGDPEPAVRLEGVRALARFRDLPARCAGLLDLTRDEEHPAVRLVAVQELAGACPDRLQPEVAARLVELADASLVAEGEPWQEGAAALEGLALVAPAAAAERVGALAAHARPFARVAAARVAARVDDTSTLRALALDPDPNVRNAALPELAARDPSAAEPLLLRELEADDPQVLITVAELLDGPPAAPLAARALDAFERLSAERRETARDPRLALLALIGRRGDAALVGRLEPFLEDHDPVVAGEVADVLGGWTGSARTPRPRPLSRLELPSAADLSTIARSTVALSMEEGGEIVIELLPLVAPTNAHRFVRLARAGYFEGLTFHRWVPGFVLQGGSPGANEFAGDGPYTRDELGHPHWRGTVGLSTRGRDTGDGQIFVNLVDNLRLDDDYTVFGRVVSGMEVVDRLLEGASIRSVEVRPGS